jgi:hypothetical protein
MALRRQEPPFRYTYAAPASDTDDSVLQVAWYETYNGSFQENQGGTDDGFNESLDPSQQPAPVTEAGAVIAESGPVLGLSNVLPGDAGTLVIGLEVTPSETAEPVDVWFRGQVTADAENGQNEVESAAGDATAAVGELDDEATVELWMDESPLGSCDGLRNFEETLRRPLVAEAPFATAFGSDSVVASEAGLKLFDSCLDPGTMRCVALSWELPADASNTVQGDSFVFDFAFAAGPCDGESPFSVGGSA